MKKIKYASLYEMKCPNCDKNGASVDRVKTKFGKLKLSSRVEGEYFNNKKWNEEFQNKLKENGIDIDASLQRVITGNIPVNRLKCENCEHFWEPDVGACEASESETLASPAYIKITRSKKFVGSAVPMLIVLNGVIIDVELLNGQTMIFPTFVKHNKVQAVYDKVSRLSNHVSTMKRQFDVQLSEGELNSFDFAAQLVMK